MADHIAVKNYKTNVASITKRFAEAIKKPTAELKKVDDELKKGGQKLPIKDYAKLAKDKKLKPLLDRREKAKKAIEKAKLNMEVNLKILPPLEDVPEKELIKLPGWLKEIVEKEGLPLGNWGSIRPDIAFDKGKIKKVGIVIKW